MWGSQLQFEGTSSKLGPISNLRAPAPIWCTNSSLVALAQTCWPQLQRININPTPITETLSKNKQPLFSTRPPKTPKKKNEISSLKNDCNLFSCPYISCQTRDGNLERFFQHENQPTFSEPAWYYEAWKQVNFVTHSGKHGNKTSMFTCC